MINNRQGGRRRGRGGQRGQNLGGQPGNRQDNRQRGNAAQLLEKFDLILCNPPYIAEGAELGRGVREFEPDEALFAGSEGLDAYRELAPQLPRLLNRGGLAAIEIAPDQFEPVSRLLARDGFAARQANDLADRPRAVLLTWV